MVTDDGHHIGECPFAFGFSLDNEHDKLNDQAYPYLDFNGILVVPQKIFQGEVLFKAFEQGFYLPPLFIDVGYGIRLEFEVIGMNSYTLFCPWW